MQVNSVVNIEDTTEIVKKHSNSNGNRNTNELGKDEFLRLLVTQLKYQDPLNPVDDKEFIAQMAQFTTLEQMYNLNSSFSSMKALNLIGKSVKAEIIDDRTGEIKSISGEVEGVKIDGRESYAVVDGIDIPIESIKMVETAEKITNEEV
ncbi:MAG TPA: flagellar hook capping FlgD N-terminal domain-containing protein [Clostridiales bacterium]|nr:flagellar hook capping FlgD N-terminal domain-containing protein [Clostridiales bacterium]